MKTRASCHTRRRKPQGKKSGICGSPHRAHRASETPTDFDDFNQSHRFGPASRDTHARGRQPRSGYRARPHRPERVDRLQRCPRRLGAHPAQRITRIGVESRHAQPYAAVRGRFLVLHVRDKRTRAIGSHHAMCEHGRVRHIEPHEPTGMQEVTIGLVPNDPRGKLL